MRLQWQQCGYRLGFGKRGYIEFEFSDAYEFWIELLVGLFVGVWHCGRDLLDLHR